MSKLRFLLLILLVLVLAGAKPSCYDKRINKKQKELLEELKTYSASYNRMIIWGDFDGASAAVVPEKRVDFLEQSQHVASMVRIEDFTIPLCQVSTVPFPREEKDEEKGERETEATPVPTPAPPPVETVGPESDQDKTPEPEVKPEKKKMPKIFYGMALVRYINMTVNPSVTVRNRLIRQYWIYLDGVWYCDADLEEMLEQH